MENWIPVSNGCQLYMLCVFTFEFCFIPLLFVYVRLCLTSNPRSIGEVPFDSVGGFRVTLLLRTTCIRSCRTWRASCVAA